MTAFVGVSVIPMDRERVLPNQTVLVRGDRVVALGPRANVKVPAGAVRVDGRGKFLIPGLADMHVHVDGKQELLPLFLANGVTTVRDMYGTREVRQLRNRVARGELVGPRIYAAVLDTCQGPERATCLAAIKADGAIMIKFYSDSRPLLDSIVAIARPLQLPIGGHVEPHVGLEAALAVPFASIEHLWGYFEVLAGIRTPIGDLDSTARQALLDTARWMRSEWRPDPRKLQEVATATRRAGTWNAPTLVITEETCWTDNPGLRLYWAIFGPRFLLVKALQDAGAGLLLSTDRPGVGSSLGAGFAVHRELELLVVAGLTPYQALATGTRNAAQYLSTLDSTGTIAVGKRADLALLEGNPLVDIRYTAGPAGVMVGGRWLSRAELDASLDSLMGSDSLLSHYNSNAAELARWRREASLHRGIRLVVSSGDSTSAPVAPPVSRGDFCDRVRAAAR